MEDDLEVRFDAWLADVEHQFTTARGPSQIQQTCANTYGQRGHVWRELTGVRRCDVCWKQEIVPDFTPLRKIWFVERYAFRTFGNRFYFGISTVGA